MVVSRRLKILRTVLIVGATITAAGGAAALWALPEIVRRVAVQKIPEITGRAAHIDDVDLNLFTGRFAVRGIRLAERDPREAFVQIDRVEGRVWLPALLGFDVRLLDLRVAGLAARVVRTGPTEFNFSDLIDLFAKVDPAAKPSRWTFTLDRVVLEGGRIAAEDRAVSPAATWSIDRLAGNATSISKRGDVGPGRADLHVKLGALDVAVAAEQIRLAPVSLSGKLTLIGLDLARLRPYVPAAIPFIVDSGMVQMKLDVAWKREPGRVELARVSGDVSVRDLGVIQAGAAGRFVQVPRVAVRIAEADAIGRRVALSSVEIEGLDLKAVRDPTGGIDLLVPVQAMRGRATAAPEAPPSPEAAPADVRAPPRAPEAPGPVWQIKVDKVGIRSSAVTFTDQVVSPAVEWRLQGLTVDAAGLDTAAGAARGTLALGSELVASSAPSMRAQVTVDANAIGLLPVTVAGTVAVKGFDYASTNPYVPPGMPAGVTEGVVNLDADLAVRPPSRTAAPGDAPGPAPPVVLEVPRFALTSPRLTVADNTLSPPKPWWLTDVRITGGGFSTSPDDPPANVLIEAGLGPPGAASPAALRMQADALRVIRRASRVRATVSGFDVSWLEPYVPPAIAAVPRTGMLSATVDTRVGRSRSGAPRARASGTAVVTEVTVARRGDPAPFFSAPKVALNIKQADGIRRAIDVASVEVGAFNLRATRGADGRIDLLELRPGAGPTEPVATAPAAPTTVPGPASADATASAPGAPPAAVQASAGAAPWKINVDRVDVAGGTAEFVDLVASPNVTLALTDIDMTALTLTWPSAGPASFTAGVGMPGGGRTQVRITGVLDPLDIQIRSMTRDAPIEPYRPYFPFPARFKGKFSGDSLNEIKKEGDVYRAASRGTAWATDIAIEDPEAKADVLRMERMDIRGIDFSWPNYALVDKVLLTRPILSVERAADGTINLRRVFTPTPKPREGAEADRAKSGEAVATPPTAEGPPKPAESQAPEAADDAPKPAEDAAERAETAAPPGEPAERKPTLLETIVLDFTELALAEGHVRFLDRTTTPFFAEQMTQMDLTIRGLSNVFGRQQTTMTLAATLGDDAHLDLRGELSGIGETLRADLVGELTNFDLTTANPYADSYTSWVVQRGRLAAKVHYRVEGDRLTAENDVNFGGLKISKSPGDDEAKKRLGLPLGLIVGLMKDTSGNIDFALPLSGTISDRQFDWGETVWAGIKQGVTKVLAGPFRAIGRLFSGGEKVDERAADLHVEPITFAPGSAVVAPAMEEHLSRVAGFLRRSPFVGLSMVPVTTGPDVDSLRSQALSAKILALQEERKLKDFDGAVRAYYRAQRIGRPPKTAEEQLAALRDREPAPDDSAVRALSDRRLEATREALSRLQGVPRDRLVAGAPKSLPSETAEGRVEFSLIAD